MQHCAEPVERRVLGMRDDGVDIRTTTDRSAAVVRCGHARLAPTSRAVICIGVDDSRTAPGPVAQSRRASPVGEPSDHYRHVSLMVSVVALRKAQKRMLFELHSALSLPRPSFRPPL